MIEPVQPEAFGDKRDWKVWARIGLQSFGGPAAQIALMHRVLVEERRWLEEAQFLRALGFCMLLPGPEAMQLATYAGWKRAGTRGALTAGLWFVMPGAVLVTALAALTTAAGERPDVRAALLGVQAAALALVVDAVRRLAARALHGARSALLAVAAWAALALFAVPFPLVVLAAGLVGALAPSAAAATDAPRPPARWSASLGVTIRWGALWLLPLAALAAVLGRGHRLVEIGVFFSQLAVVTFGGAYAALTWMAQELVSGRGWLSSEQMLTGLGLAETTPGPLVLVGAFVGSVAAANAHPDAALAAGVAGSAVALWSTFVPCFLWVLAGAPHVEGLASRPRLQGALAAITAAVVGVIAHLALWFAQHVLFSDRWIWSFGRMRLELADVASFDPRALVLGATAALLLFGLRWSVHRTLAMSALLSMLMLRLQG